MANVDNYNIDAIEKKMQKMSPKTASRLGETQKKAPQKKSTVKKGK